MLRLLQEFALAALLVAASINPSTSLVPISNAKTRKDFRAAATSNSSPLFANKNRSPTAKALNIRGGSSSSTQLESMTYSYLAGQTAAFAVFCGLGDMIAQRIEMSEAKQQLKVNGGGSAALAAAATTMDWNRTKKFFFKGFGCGIIWTNWFRLSDLWSFGITEKVLSMAWFDPISAALTIPKSKTLVNTISCILLEQFVAAPIIFGLWDIPMLNLLLGTPVRKIPGEVKEKLIPILIANAKLWTFANIIIYNLPVQWRVTGVSLTDLLWSAIMSMAVQSKKEEPEVQQKALNVGTAAKKAITGSISKDPFYKALEGEGTSRVAPELAAASARKS